jgi:putative aldouronate transport system permease protein
MKKKLSLFHSTTYFIISLITILCIAPMLLVVMVSFSSEESIIRNGYQFIPQDLSLEAYRTMLKYG